MYNYYFGQPLFIDRSLDDDRAPGAPISPFRQMGVSDILRACKSHVIIYFVQCRTIDGSEVVFQKKATSLFPKSRVRDVAGFI
jgi:hypothetical protein